MDLLETVGHLLIRLLCRHPHLSLSCGLAQQPNPLYPKCKCAAKTGKSNLQRR